jgi:RND superfamily putative drug exporter
VVVKADDVNAPKVKTAIADFTAKAEKDAQVVGDVAIDVNPSHTVAILDVGLPGTGTDDQSQNALKHLRGDLIPATLGHAPGATVAVSGGAAANADFNTLMSSKTPLVFAFVLTFAFLLLLISFRSIVIAAKAVILNLLSVGASYGMLTLVFQDGHGEKLLGFESNGGIGSWLPLFLFVILFGLSMDYHVFMISRIREAWQRGMSTEEAVSHGIRSTAGTITAAAVVMVSSFAVFAFLSSVEMKELGVGLSFAILLDATIIRGVLLPATMKLLGDWNWYLPRPLRWLPEINHGAGSPVPAPA